MCLGKVNFEEGSLSAAASCPIGAGLHEPVVTCCPFVIGRSGRVRQKLMKLLAEVRDFVWLPEEPSVAKLADMTLGSSAVNQFTDQLRVKIDDDVLRESCMSS